MNSKASMVNTALLAVVLGVMGWVGIKATESAETIAGVKVSLQTAAEATARLDKKLDEMVPRREYDTRILAIEQAQRSLDVRLREIDLELIKLKKQP